jgi:hypothetical protein
MCWAGKNNPQIAKEDIKVFKVVIAGNNNSFFCSIYYKFMYRLGFVYSSRIKKKLFDSAQIKITKGIHSYSKYCKIAASKDLLFIRNRMNNEASIDVFSKYYLFSQQDFYRLECIIPKRSAYYENENGEIVSSRLKIIKATKL